MEDKVRRQAGLLLLMGVFLWFVTMVLHPVGGSIEHIRSIRGLIISTHVIAILSLPFCLYGFYGIMLYAGRNLISQLGFIFSFFALVAAMGAAGVNGLALPFFIDGISEVDGEGVSHVMRYSMALNHMFDYIFIGGLIIAVSFWSISIIRNRDTYRWMGYFGLLISVLIIFMHIFGFYFLDLSGFRVFVLTFILWILGMGILMLRKNPKHH